MIDAIETKDLCKKFRIGVKGHHTLFTTIRYKLSGETPTRELWALRNINFSVNKGEMVAIIGPNGAGKTTLLRILSGIMVPTSGTYHVTGGVSCIFELGLGFNPNFTALQNVYLYGALHGFSHKQIDKKLPQIIEFSELEKFMDAKLRNFSSGMIQRLAFATVIQTVEGIVMVDAVLSVGDMAFQKKCIDAFTRLIRWGNTVLLVTHGLGEAKNLCQKALYLNGGNQIAFGSVEEMETLYERDRQEHFQKRAVWI